jgi:hypothetical protein
VPEKVKLESNHCGNHLRAAQALLSRRTKAIEAKKRWQFTFFGKHITRW